MSERDIDAEFDAIVARWDDEGVGSTSVTPTAPTVEPLPEDPAPEHPATEGPVSPEPPPLRTVQDITAAYAALSAPETAVPPGAVPPEGGTDRALADSTDSGAGDWRRGPDTVDEEHFEPGPVQLPPGEDIGYWGAVVGLVGGPLVLLWVVIGKPFYAGWWTAGAITAFLGGFALLVLRQPKDRDPYDGDDGARV